MSETHAENGNGNGGFQNKLAWAAVMGFVSLICIGFSFLFGRIISMPTREELSEGSRHRAEITEAKLDVIRQVSQSTISQIIDINRDVQDLKKSIDAMRMEVQDVNKNALMHRYEVYKSMKKDEIMP